MKFEVHHLDWSRAREQEPKLFADATVLADSDAVRTLQERGFYAHVAAVELEPAEEEPALEEVYMLTNSIDRHWSENSEVTITDSPKLRSTSVGDILCIKDRHYLVAALGFERL